MAHDLLSVYPAKLMEYGLAVGYLFLFIPFWRYVQGGPRQAAVLQAGAAAHATARPAARSEAAARPARVPRPAADGWFRVPAGVHLHPGHTWARLEPDGLVAIGADDFAHKLVGPARVDLPAVGAKVLQGEPALEIGAEGKRVPMLSPIDGTVVAVNAATREKADGIDDPYGAGWLFKVKASRLAANLRQLHGEISARRMLEEAGERLALRMAPELGRVLQDGGAPVHGIARALAGEGWDGLAREFFLT
jgi:glycine cleavage system H protein